MVLPDDFDKIPSGTWRMLTKRVKRRYLPKCPLPDYPGSHVYIYTHTPYNKEGIYFENSTDL